MCGCKKGKKAVKRRKKGGFLAHSAIPRRYVPKARKRAPKCIKCRKANAGVWMKGKGTKRKSQFRQKMVGGRRGHKRGAQWIDDDYLANMPVMGSKKTKGRGKYAFLM